MFRGIMWQWIHNSYGGMGWFTDEDKQKVEGHPDFNDGSWRLIPTEEVASMNRTIGQMAYEQS